MEKSSNSRLLLAGAKSVVECESKPGNQLTEDPAFKNLRNYHNKCANMDMNSEFVDPFRFDRMR